MSDSEDATKAKTSEMTEGKWESLPADSEAVVDYPKPSEVVTLPYVGQDYREVNVRMEVHLPDGSRFTYEETTELPKDSELDPYAMALESANEVSAVMVTRLEGMQL